MVRGSLRVPGAAGPVVWRDEAVLAPRVAHTVSGQGPRRLVLLRRGRIDGRLRACRSVDTGRAGQLARGGRTRARLAARTQHSIPILHRARQVRDLPGDDARGDPRPESHV